jgi:hypothetical protein
MTLQEAEEVYSYNDVLDFNEALDYRDYCEQAAEKAAMARSKKQ